ncbi:hypothetical protein EB796_018054 [Bugula neritina]|uniref:Uncharacterized protein n=1 Tax=Bugula neritina TaxID=10212 RepID=A0A7J7JCA3_BUGNE|nr:hypothetical protein EB796_018054 [Bugula neritina]
MAKQKLYYQVIREELKPTALQLTLISCAIILSIKGQDIKPVNICDNNTVTVDRGYAGIIEHREIEGAPVTCSLTLRAPAGIYISIPEVDAAAEGATCPEIQIDGTTYCIDSTQPAGIIQKFTQEQSVLSVSTLNNMAGFNLEFFTTGNY